MLKYNMPRNVAVIVSAIYADYGRREAELERKTQSRAVLEKYEELNVAVEIALECVEENIRDAILGDITRGRGYEASPLSPIMAKNTYYERKREVMCELGRILALI